MAGTTLSLSVAATYAHQASYKMVVRNTVAAVESSPVALVVNDVTAPTVTLTGAATVTVNQNSTWTDPGATAADDRDGTLTATRSGTLDLTTPGTYLLTYTATDAAGRSGTVTRTVTVVAVWSLVASEPTGGQYISNGVVNNTGNLFFAERGSDELLLQQFSPANPSAGITNVSSYPGVGMVRGYFISVGNDARTLYIGDINFIISWNGSAWTSVAGAPFNSVGGFALHIGSSNRPYVAAMDNSTYHNRIWRFTGAWEMVGGDVDVPLGISGFWQGDFCITSSQVVYTIGKVVDPADSGIAIGSLSGGAWNETVLQRYRNDDRRNYRNIISSGTSVVAGFTNAADADPTIYRLNGASWSVLPSMSNSTSAAGPFGMAFSPSGELYAAHVEGANVVFKKLNSSGTSWTNVPSTSGGTAFTASGASGITLAISSSRIFAIVNKSGLMEIWSYQLN